MIKILAEKINRKELEKIAQETYGEMVKFAVDIKKGIIALGGQLHSDAEEKLLKRGSKSRDIWGANIYLDRPKKDRIEFTALINIKPSMANRSMEIENRVIEEKIKKIV
ncbi:MAG: DUF5674 family protein, partial [bacterium]|nr:DUF5674 family protein [bacterium]